MSDKAQATAPSTKKQTKPAAPAKDAKKRVKRPSNGLRSHGHIQRVQPRLYVRAVFTGYKRQKHTQHNNIATIKIENVESRTEAQWYVGKKCAYVVKAKPQRKGVRRFAKRKPNAAHVTWGKIRKVHGNAGLVYAVFRSNLPPVAMGRRIRVMLYPSLI